MKNVKQVPRYRLCDKCGKEIPAGEAYIGKPYGDFHQDCFFKMCRFKDARIYGEDLDD